MKKFMKILIVGVMCVSLAGCGNMTNTSTGSNAENSVVTPSPEPTKGNTEIQSWRCDVFRRRWY